MHLLRQAIQARRYQKGDDIYLDAGHIAQNLYLAGTAAGLGVCGIGAFFDDPVNALIGADGAEETT
jgi:nitroreductase